MKTKLLKKIRRNFWVEYIPAYKEYVCHYLAFCSFDSGVGHYSPIIKKITFDEGVALCIQNGYSKIPATLEETNLCMKRACNIFLSQKIREYAKYKGYTKYLKSYKI